MANVNTVIYELESVIVELENIICQIESGLQGVGESYCISSLQACKKKYQTILNQIYADKGTFSGGGGGCRF